MPTTIKDILECIYYIVFIILTIIIVGTGILSYKNQKRRTARVLVRVNYNYDQAFPAPDRKIPVTIDLYNAGDEPQEDLMLIFRSQNDFDDPFVGYKRNTVPNPNRIFFRRIRSTEFYSTREIIPFIAPHDTYKYVIGWNDGRIIEWNQAGKVKARTIIERNAILGNEYIYRWENENTLHVVCFIMEKTGEST